jgi:hypothetical protein
VQQCSSPTCCSDLSHELLVRVLRCVELPQRLGPCSVVCSAWHTAAAAATSTVAVRMQGSCNADDDEGEDLWELEGEAPTELVASRDSAGGLEQWLAAHGECVTQLSIKTPKVGVGSPPEARLLLQLPFAQLQRLRSFTCCNAQLQNLQLGSNSTAGLQQRHLQDMQGAAQQPSSHTAAHASSSSSSSSSAAVLQAALPSLTNLTTLQLRRVEYCCSGGLAALSALTGLQQLQLTEFPEDGDEQQQAGGRDHQNQMDYLPTFTQLTRLQLDVRLLPQGAVGLFSRLQRLQELTLEGGTALSLDVLQKLPPSIAKLRLCVGLQESISISTVPALAQLSALTYLEVCDCGPPVWQPGVDDVGIEVDFLLYLKHLEQLQVLDLDGSMGSNTARTLMSVVPCLTNLSRMRLCMYDCAEGGAPEHVSDLTRCSALLPSGPHLTRFTLTASLAWMLPAGCGTYLLSPGQQLPQLKVLELGPCEYPSFERSEHFLNFAGAAHGGVKTPVACFGPGDVERLVCCCPGLERLWMPGLVQAGVDVSALLRLTALTGLFVGGEVWDDNVAVSVLAGMSGLQELQLCDAPDFTDQGLLALVDLTRLTKLGVLSCALSEALPTFLDGRETTDEDEEEGGFLLWKQVGGLVAAFAAARCRVTLDVKSFGWSFCK